MDEEEDDVPTCPLCLEELDATDRAVKACQCGYQVCLWCLHTIREQLNQRCPACRTPYEEQNFKIGDVNPEEAAKEVKERRTAKKERERREKLKEIERERERALLLSQQKAKSNLQHVRILQRNLVYIIGLSLSLAREEVIRRNDMFGKFGRMLRVLVNRSHPFHADAPGGPSISAYVQYQRDIDAGSAVRAMNNAVLDGREIRCAIATSKYCEAFVAGVQNCDVPTAAFYHCGNANCLYYHTTAQADNILTREEVLARQLGPPPPSHLFLPIIPRRPGPPSVNRPANSQSTTQGPSTSASTISLNRPFVNSVTTSQPHCSTSALNTSSASSQPVAPTVPLEHPLMSGSVQTTVTVSAGKSPSLPSQSPRVEEGVNLVHKSSSGSQSEEKHTDAPAQNLLPGNLYSSHLSSLQLLLPGASAPLPSSSTWASTQPGHPVVPSSKKPSVSAIPNALQVESSAERRSAQQSPNPLCGVPPGFEIVGSVSSSSPLPSIPPGFDGPLQSLPHREETSASLSKGLNLFADCQGKISKGEKDLRPSSTIAPPPGFGSYSGFSGNQEESDAQSHATEWLRKAPSDEVFFRRDRAESPFAREAQNHDPVLNTSVLVDRVIKSGELHGNLHQMVPSISGSLAISSGLRDETGPSSLLNMRYDGLVPQVGLNQGIDNRNEAGMQGMNFDPNLATNEVISLVPDALQVSHSCQVSGIVSNSGGSTPLASSETARSALTVAGRRKHSRFVFARQGGFETNGGNSELDLVSGVKSDTLASKPSQFCPQFNPIKSEPLNVRNEDKFSELVASKKGTAGRHARSRFDFADQSYSSSLNPGDFQNIQSGQDLFRVIDSRERSGSWSKDKRLNGHKLESRGGDLTDLGGAEVHESTGGTAQSVKWPINNSQSSFYQESESAGLFANSKFIQGTNRQANIVGLKEKEDKSGFRDSEGFPTTEQAETSNIRNMRSLDGNREPQVMTFYPPGFREATSGIPPDITAGEKRSVSGVANRAMSGGDKAAIVFGQSGSERGENSVYQGIEEHTSSGGETVEEDRRKNRTQKKRDRKRSGRDPTERKMDNKSTVVGNSSHFDIKSFNDSFFKQRATSSISARVSGGNENGDFVVSDDEVRQVRKNAVKGEESVVADRGVVDSESGGESPGRNFCDRNAAHSTTDDDNHVVRREGSAGNTSSATAHSQTSGDESGQYMSVSELEREVEAARVREAQLQDKLMEITRRLRSYDIVRS